MSLDVPDPRSRHAGRMAGPEAAAQGLDRLRGRRSRAADTARLCRAIADEPDRMGGQHP